VNRRKHRQLEQAKGAERLEPKGVRPGTGTGMFPVADVEPSV